MAMDYSRFGTRISLSDRFALIRKETLKRANTVAPVIDTQQQAPRDANRPMKNFNSTVSRGDRPSAALEQGSERNKRLVYQMAVAPSVLAEINHTYEPQIRAQLPVLLQPSIMRNNALYNNALYKPAAAQAVPVQRGVRQRLGLAHNGHKVSIKSRLGVKRKPISQRIGLPKLAASSNVVSNRGRNINGSQPRVTNKVAFKRKGPVPRANQNLRGNKPITARKSLPVRKQLPVGKPTAAQLDHDLDGYMKKTKGKLNAELDAYMAQA